MSCTATPYSQQPLLLTIHRKQSACQSSFPGQRRLWSTCWWHRIDKALPISSYCLTLSLFLQPLANLLTMATNREWLWWAFLLYSAILADGLFSIRGKGDGGRLGFVHENPAFLPTPNPFLDSVHSIALGGLRSVALTSTDQIFAWLLLHPSIYFLPLQYYFLL